MTDKSKLRKKDLEQISAYLDGELKARDLQRFEARLVEDISLQTALQEMADTKHLLRQLPQVRPPKHFILSPEMVEQKSTVNLFPVFRLATVLATVLFAVLVGTDALFISSPGGPQAAPMVSEQNTGRAEFESAAPAEGLAEAPVAADEEGFMDLVTEASVAEEAAMEPGILPEETGTPAARGGGIEVTPARGEATSEILGLVPQETATSVREVATPQPSPTEEPPTEESTSFSTAVPEPQPAVAEIEEPADSADFNLIRAAEIALGAAALLLAIATFLLRRAS